MNGVDKLTNILSSYIKKDKTYPYDTEGKVKRIDKETGKAYVEFGDYGETPVDMSIDAKPGDLVKVRVSGGDAWIVGNSSAPPTDDRVARQALKTARYGKKEIEKIVKRIDEGDFETQPGPPGEDAPIITGVVIEYCLATARTIPEGGTFDDIQATDWSEEIPDPVTGQFYWMRTITVMSDGTEVVSDPMFAMSVQASIEAGIAAANAQAAATTAEGIANAANQTANTKRRVFNAQPTTPYDENDIWFDGVHGKIYLCTKEGGRQTGNFTASDWTEYSEDVSNHFWYDSSGAHVAQTQGDVTTGNAQTISANGTVITRDGKLITSWTGTGANDAAINFYDLDTETLGDSNHLVASYAKAGITQYINNRIAMALTASGLTFKSPDTNAWTEAVFGPSGADIYANNKVRTRVDATGLTVYDSDGETPLAAFKGTGVSFNTGKPFTLGNDNSYIKWVYENGAWRIRIAADSVSFDGSPVAKADSVVANVVVEYAVGDSPSSAPSTGWSTGTPTWTEGKYIWQRTSKTIGSKTTYTYACIQGAKGETGEQGEKGNPGTNGTNGTTFTPSVDANGNISWTNDGGKTNPTTRNIKGPQGNPGTNGTNGKDGTSYYAYVRYSANASGNPMVTEPTSTTKYIGVYTGTSSTVPTYDNFIWSKYIGEDGTPGAQGPQGIQGNPGTPGASVAEVKVLYYHKSGTTAPAKPTSEVTSTSTAANVWTTSVPNYTTGYYYFTCAQTKLSTGSFIWSDPVLDSGLTDIAELLDGKADASDALYSAVPVYYRSTTHTTPTISRSTTIYTSDDTDNQWSYVMPKPSKNKYFYETIRTVAADGTITHETVREINTATYASKWVHSSDSTQIDGGALYANSVTADKINVNNLISVGGLATNSDIEDVESQAQSAISTANSASSTASTASSNASTALSRANTAISDASDAAKTATNYLGYLSSATGLCVHDSGNTSNFVNVNSSSVNVYKSGNKVAEFGSTIKLGNTSSTSGFYQEIGSSNITLYRGTTLQGGIHSDGGTNSSGISISNTNSSTDYDGAKVKCYYGGVELTHNNTNSTAGRAYAALVKHANLGNVLMLGSGTNMYIEPGYGVRSSSGQLLGESTQGNVLVGWGIKDSGGALNLYGYSGIYARSKFHAASGGDYTGSWTSTSDKRLKEKIEALNSNVDDVILDLKPVEYDLKEDESGTRYFGLIAQDVAETLEKYGYDSKKYSTVNELGNPEGYLGIDYNDFIPMLIHICQSQQKKIDDLEERLSKLEGKLE